MIKQLTKKEVVLISGAELSFVEASTYYWAYEGCRKAVPMFVDVVRHPVKAMVANYGCFLGSKYLGDGFKKLYDYFLSLGSDTTPARPRGDEL
jgi:hypothetical protein